jgi:hypothetical protein
MIGHGNPPKIVVMHSRDGESLNPEFIFLAVSGVPVKQ